MIGDSTQFTPCESCFLQFIPLVHFDPVFIRQGSQRSATESHRASTRTPGGCSSPSRQYIAYSAPFSDPYEQAMEITSPFSTYNLLIRTREKNKTKPKNAPPLRGRVTLPQDPRLVRDTILVFAEPNSKSRQLAEEVGVDYLGAEDLFEPLTTGEITPAKVLSTPGMLPAVTRELARFLGPKGMMPTTRRGGVGEGEELVERIKEAKGSLDWQADDRGWINVGASTACFHIRPDHVSQ